MRTAGYADERVAEDFIYLHWPQSFLPVGRKFNALAHLIIKDIPSGPDRDAALEKLSAARDDVARAVEIAEGRPPLENWNPRPDRAGTGALP